MVSIFPLGLPLGVSAALILLGVMLFIKTLRFRTKAQRVDALLVKVEEFGECREDGLIAYWFSYEYTAPDGRVIYARQSSLRWQNPLVGTNCTMLVDPQNPKSLRQPGVREYLVPLVLVLTSLVMQCMNAILL